MDKAKSFFSQNQCSFFDFQKTAREASPTPSTNCTPVKKAEYASITLDIPKYP